MQWDAQVSEKDQINERINKLVSANNPDEVKQAYKHWATDYDTDLATFGYVAPQIGTELFFDKVIDKTGLIHDAGCGTGLIGKILSDHGYKRLHGSDFSQEMIEQAQTTGCYSELMSLDFGRPLTIEDNAYSAVISIGVYTKRFKQHFLPEMIRIVQPSGYFVFSLREQYYDEVMASTSELLKDKTISNVSLHHNEYMQEQGASAFYIALQKSGV